MCAFVYGCVKIFPMWKCIIIKFTASFYIFLTAIVHVVVLHEHKVYQAQHLDTMNTRVLISP
jgi:hypothetical protein